MGQRLGARAKELLAIDPRLSAIDPNVTAAAQMALTEARKSATIENPRQALSFFFDCFKSLHFTLVHKTAPVEIELLDRVSVMLQFRDATLPLSVALPIAVYADNMLNNFRFEPWFESHHLVDISHHFTLSSSLGEKARLLFNVVRALKPKACLEIGTAYGISAYLIARCQELCALQAHVVTVEAGSPQKEISQVFLQRHFPQNVKTLHADKHDAIAQLMAASQKFDFVFHDNGHSGDHYVRDFAELLPLMPAGAVFVLDDIKWFGPGQGPSRRTCYEGWLEIIRNQRVADAIEISSTSNRGSMGVLVLR
jgi:predicted O-methyltransferase YrrM